MAGCPSCGTENTAEARFCSACGTALGPVVATREMRKTVTVLFADVTGSTALGEQLDPETLRAVMGRYFAMMKGVIEAHGGTVEKFIGDAVMAVFGIPSVHEDDALRAVRAAAEIRTELAALNAELERSRGIAIRFRTGLNTGEVVAGDPAAGQTLVTGDTVNTAARLEQAAPPGEILLGALTWSLVRDAVEVEPVAPIAAKGKALPLTAWRLVAVRAGVAGHARRLDAPLVGRERELARLEQAFRGAVEERSCQLFTLLGVAGVGKSRLVAEFTAAVAPEARVLVGRCLSYGEGITYWPIGEIVRSAAGISETDSPEAARDRIRVLLEGERDADVLAARVAAAIGLSSEPAPQEELFWAIRKLLEHLAREQPLVVVVEDIHWAEPTLLDLLEHIADWSRDAPLLVLCPARPELLDARPGWGGGKLNATTVLLEALGPEAAGRLVAALPGGAALPPAVVERILAAAEGNPLYVEELLAMLVDEGLLRQQESDGTWQAEPGIAEVRVPATISALLAARLERLGPAERQVAERASVVGRVFEQDAVTELSDEASRPAVAASLLALVRKELVRPDRSELTPGDAFRFRHILIRDAAYEALPKAERAILHERFADWLERTAGDRLAEVEEILGYHLGEAHRYRTELGESGPELERLGERAGERLAAAGRRATELNDLSSALDLLGRAAELLPPGRARLTARVEVGRLTGSLGRHEESEAVLADSEDAARRSGEVGIAEYARIAGLRLRATVDPGLDLAAASESIHAGLATFDPEHDAGLLSYAWGSISLLRGMASQEGEALAAAEQALTFADRAGSRAARTVALTAIGNALVDSPIAVGAAIRRLEAIRGDANSGRDARSSSAQLGVLKAMAGDIEAARLLILDGRRFAEEIGDPREAAIAMGSLGHAELIADNPTAAIEALRSSLDQFTALGDEASRSISAVLLARALLEVDHDDDAIAMADDAERITNAEEWSLQAWLRSARARISARRGDDRTADRLSSEAVTIAHRGDRLVTQGDALLDRARVLVTMGQIDAARVLASEAIERYERKGSIASVAKARRILGDLPSPL